ncbi:hypothetical protein [Budvicia aquatica]|uniref:Uncharacterized protein n=1 Tax=Budvicia aquatica TaxID=82979 RepID=A0A484ZP33_9GAMM|nr:hypothetical protein [Budvicia aquatica]VFS49153.1 Uncharacterised protein [Budvicia aquatica]
MRVTGLDIVMSVVTLLAIAVMIPMPWLLSSSQEGVLEILWCDTRLFL